PELLEVGIGTDEIDTYSPLYCIGFISIDCGLRNRSSYNDSATGLRFDPDGGFVEGGMIKKISHEFMDAAENEQQKTLRSFPD
uniref:Malectin-like domain-containing protein n=1 Tax=Triticum urartu TaxID=4572 RepID=A0A8R7UPR2_TRIUA